MSSLKYLGKRILKAIIIPVIGIIENWAIGNYLLINYVNKYSGAPSFSFERPEGLVPWLFFLFAWIAAICAFLLIVNEIVTWRKARRP